MKSLFFHSLLGAALLLAALSGYHAAAAEPVPAQDCIVIVLDASGSMKGMLNVNGGRLSKMDAAKTALKEVLQTLPASTKVGLLIFSASNLTNDWAFPLGPRDDTALMRAIDSPQPHQGTPLGAYIKKGADRLLEERAKQFGYGVYRLLVVTDGEASDAALVERYTPDVISRGITFDVIGVGMKKTHTLATKVHSYRPANDMASLKRALLEVLGEVAATSDATQDAFDSIAPIPTEVAAAMIQALSVSDNRPIGERAKSASPVKRNNETTNPKATAPIAPAPPAPLTPISTPPRERHEKKGARTAMIVIITIIAAGIIRRSAKGRER